MTTRGRSPGRPPTGSPGARVVTGCFIVLAVSSGLGFYGLAVYLNAFSRERGWPVASISLATTLFFIVGGRRRAVRSPGSSPAATSASSIVAGGIARRRGARRCSARSRSAGSCTSSTPCSPLGFAGAGLVPGRPPSSPAGTTPALGRAVGGLDRAVGRRHRAHAGGQVADRRSRAGSRRRRSSARSGWSASCRSPCGSCAPTRPSLGWLPDGERVRSTSPRRCRRRHAVRRGACGPASSSRVTVGYVLVLGAQVGGIQQLVKLVEERTDAGHGRAGDDRRWPARRWSPGSSAGASCPGVPMAAFTVVLAALQAVVAGRARLRRRARWRSSPRSSCSARRSATS